MKHCTVIEKDLAQDFPSDAETYGHSRDEWFKDYEVKFASVSIAPSQNLKRKKSEKMEKECLHCGNAWYQGIKKTFEICQ